MLKLYEYGEMNQSRLMSICGLNNVKHKEILDSMVNKQMIERKEEAWGSKTIYKYKLLKKEKPFLKKYYNAMRIYSQEIMERNKID